MFAQLKKSIKFVNEIKDGKEVYKQGLKFKVKKRHTDDNIFDIVSRLRKYEIYNAGENSLMSNKHIKQSLSNDFNKIVDYFRDIVKEKINADLRESKIMGIFETMAKTATTQIISTDELLFGKGEMITGLYILVEGKIGLSKESKERFEKTNDISNKLKVPPADLFFEICDKPNSFICEFEICKNCNFKTSAV
jgi:hypothetical protein